MRWGRSRQKGNGRELSDGVGERAVPGAGPGVRNASGVGVFAGPGGSARGGGAGRAPAARLRRLLRLEPVSYTHLTLPTIYSV